VSRSWREWGPPLLHPLTTLIVMSTAALVFPRLMLPAMGIVYLMAGASVGRLAGVSRVSAAAVAVASAGLALPASLGYVQLMRLPSAEDKALEWIEAHLPPGARILETRPDARPGGRPGSTIGIDPTRYEVLYLGTDEDKAGLRLLAPHMDLVLTGPGLGGRWGQALEPVYRAFGPEGAFVLQLKMPRMEARPRYVPLDPMSFNVSASHNPAALPALHDCDFTTAWTSGRPLLGGEWLEVQLDRPQRVGRVELHFVRPPEHYGPEVEVLVQDEGGRWVAPRVVRARPPIEELAALGKPLSEVLLIEPRLTRAVRLIQSGRRPEPWTIAELRIDVREEDPPPADPPGAPQMADVAFTALEADAPR
jgi:hypothetical protein